jgi:hypothetical protein
MTDVLHAALEPGISAVGNDDSAVTAPA